MGKAKKAKGPKSYSSAFSKQSKSSIESVSVSAHTISSGMKSSSSRSDAQDDTSKLQEELKGNVVTMAKQQYGSKQLQRYLEKAAPEFVGFIIEEVLNDLHDLMCDSYGNYFC